MYAVGLHTAAIALPAMPAVAPSPQGAGAGLEAANDAAPGGERGAVTLPARLDVRGRRERAALSVDISRETVTFRHRSAGGAVATARPLASYRGIAVTVERGEGEPIFHLSLMHEDAAQCVPLSSGTDVAAMAREWQAWAKALSLPLVAVEADGTVHAELTALGVVLAERPSPRRRGSPLVGRRSRYARRRRAMTPARPLSQVPRIAGEREIIART